MNGGIDYKEALQASCGEEINIQYPDCGDDWTGCSNPPVYYK